MRTLHLVATLALGLALAGCGSSFAMTPDSGVPFATGTIDASFEENGNNEFTMKVAGLGPPSKLVPGATTYIVWLTPKKEGATAQNIGALTVEDDGKGELEFKSTVNAFSIVVTAEAAADVLKPTGREVLKASVAE